MIDSRKGCLSFVNGDFTQAASQFLEAAQNGDAEAAFDYGFCLQNGFGVPVNPAQAKSFYSFAKELPGGDACYNLAILYMHGYGVKKNHKKAFQLMTDAADLGCVEAMLYLGTAYTTGTVFEPEIICISRIPYHKPLYRDTAGLLSGDVDFDEKDEDERVNVVMADARQAYSWFRAAAHHKDTEYVGELVAKAQFLYAKCYVDGFGTEFDNDKAARIMLIAGRNGSPEALSFLAEHGVTQDMLYEKDPKKGKLLGR